MLKFYEIKAYLKLTYTYQHIFIYNLFTDACKDNEFNCRQTPIKCLPLGDVCDSYRGVGSESCEDPNKPTFDELHCGNLKYCDLFRSTSI